MQAVKKEDIEEESLQHHLEVLKENTCVVCLRPRINLVHYSSQCIKHLVSLRPIDEQALG
jgi:hypothetical protein